MAIDVSKLTLRGQRSPSELGIKPFQISVVSDVMSRLHQAARLCRAAKRESRRECSGGDEEAQRAAEVRFDLLDLRSVELTST